MTLIIINTAPTLDLEPIELLLASAAFDQQPKLLLLNQGIFYANALQQEKRIKGKSAAKILAALPLYDCDEIYVRQKDLEHFGLDASSLQPFCTLINDAEIKTLIGQSNHCVSF